MVLVHLMLPCIAACKHDAQVYGTVTSAGKGVPGARITLECPDGTKRAVGTNSLGDFRFEELGAALADACTEARCDFQTK
jgi:hypothetical protein